MITIVKGNEKVVCSEKTYLEQYKQLGYLPASEIKKEATIKVASSLKSEEDTEKEKISEKYGVKKKSTKKGE